MFSSLQTFADMNTASAITMLSFNLLLHFEPEKSLSSGFGLPSVPTRKYCIAVAQWSNSRHCTSCCSISYHIC
ncbi:hypothetical protein ACOSP7_003788 [Xanthoceras sorbifolium]